eukprot:6181207-Pleurochrysis_carterae.AAC.1
MDETQRHLRLRAQKPGFVTRECSLVLVRRRPVARQVARDQARQLHARARLLLYGMPKRLLLALARCELFLSHELCAKCSEKRARLQVVVR